MVFGLTAVDTRQLWQTALSELQIQMLPQDFRMFRNTNLVSIDGPTCTIGVENPFSVSWLNSKCRTPVARTLRGLLGRTVDVTFDAVRREPEAGPPPPLTLEPSPPEGHRGRKRRPADPPQLTVTARARYTFDTFVVGENCKLAHAASTAVAERPGDAYNPLFIYGGVGLGKTHLLHAIGHAVQRRGDGVIYASCEAFTNDFTESLRRNRMEDFRAKYRQADVLLLDDVQFLAGKEGTQQEFFHTFNALHEDGRQIVLTSDRAPSAVPTLEERLRSRFAGGLMADIQPPDVETRAAILRAKAASCAERRGSAMVTADALDLIAERVDTNIRELEGALNRVMAYADSVGAPVTVEMAASVLRDLRGPTARPSPALVIDAVCRAAGVSVEEVTGKQRDRRVTLPRQIAMFLLRERTDLSLIQVGALLGGRDHSTVLHSCEKIAAEIEADDLRRREVQALRQAIAKTCGG